MKPVAPCLQLSWSSARIPTPGPARPPDPESELFALLRAAARCRLGRPAGTECPSRHSLSVLF